MEPPGARPAPQGGVAFRVWAPSAARVTVVLERGEHALAPAAGGWHGGIVAQAEIGSRYRFRLDQRGPFPDPASRSQPEGPHGPSEVVDDTFAWSDPDWRGLTLDGQVLYEMHVGTFTPEGTWRAAAALLPELRDIGITAIAMMPVAEYPGRFGWGYDGVDLFAPSHLYGRPDDLRAFVDRAHALGLGVVLDVVYNHLGPAGNYLKQFSGDYFTDRYANEWGEAINFDGPGCEAVRAFFIANAAYWIGSFHFDGLRLDATQSMYDRSPEPIVAAITTAARAAAPGRRILMIGENEPQDSRLLIPVEQGGGGLDALWNDDFHHSAMVAATGRAEAYYSDHAGRAQEFVSAAKHGFLFQGQRYAWQGKRRGRPSLGVPGKHFVNYLQNHDQVANSAKGLRLHALAAPAQYRALTALLLLLPGTPLLFQGQEYQATAPFLYFADHEPDLARLVAKGRRAFLEQFPSIAVPAVGACIPDPGDEATFRACVLDPAERSRHTEAVALHRDLLRLRREDPAFAAQGAFGLDGATLSEHALALRWFGPHPRLLLVNLGTDLVLRSAPEPLLAPPEGAGWAQLWSSENSPYGGCGAPDPEQGDGWRLPAYSALVLAPAR